MAEFIIICTLFLSIAIQFYLLKYLKLTYSILKSQLKE